MTDEERRDATRRSRRTSGRDGGRRDTDPPETWISIAKYARVWGLSRPTVYKLLESGLLTTYETHAGGPITRILNAPPKKVSS